MNLAQAIEKHAEWKLRFRNAIASQEIMDTATIARDNCCELGRWLHGEARAKYGKLLSYADCVNTHARFHTEAGKVAAAINAKRFSEAEAMIGSGSPYLTASGAVGGAIMRFKKEVGL
jgi:methyl-accepting chemotaxis protein